MVPEMPCSLITSFSAIAAAMAPGPRRLCPQPWPSVTWSLRASLRGSASLPSPGKASYSASTPRIGEPLPHSAINAVGTPDVPLLTIAKPSSCKLFMSSCADFTSCSEISANSQSLPARRSMTGLTCSTARSTASKDGGVMNLCLPFICCRIPVELKERQVQRRKQQKQDRSKEHYERDHREEAVDQVNIFTGALVVNDFAGLPEKDPFYPLEPDRIPMFAQIDDVERVTEHQAPIQRGEGKKIGEHQKVEREKAKDSYCAGKAVLGT